MAAVVLTILQLVSYSRIRAQFPLGLVTLLTLAVWGLGLVGTFEALDGT